MIQGACACASENPKLNCRAATFEMFSGKQEIMGYQ
jgi:hypothetical protein